MGRTVLRANLDERVAERFVQPAVDDLLRAIRDAAARKAPDGKTWATVRDERVRHSHDEADMTLIPANVPYILSKPGGGHETGNAPRDPAFSMANRYNCRCQSLAVAGVVGLSLQTDLQVSGASVHGRVYTDFERAAESEGASDGGGWLIAGAREAIAQRAT